MGSSLCRIMGYWRSLSGDASDGQSCKAWRRLRALYRFLLALAGLGARGRGSPQSVGAGPGHPGRADPEGDAWGWGGGGGEDCLGLLPALMRINFAEGSFELSGTYSGTWAENCDFHIS